MSLRKLSWFGQDIAHFSAAGVRQARRKWRGHCCLRDWRVAKRTCVGIKAPSKNHGRQECPPYFPAAGPAHPQSQTIGRESQSHLIQSGQSSIRWNLSAPLFPPKIQRGAHPRSPPPFHPAHKTDRNDCIASTQSSICTCCSSLSRGRPGSRLLTLWGPA